MSEADRMFGELGYKKIFDSHHQIVYENLENTIKRIDIRNDQKTIYITFKELFNNIYDNRISVEELQAINKKVQELGWIE